MNASDGLADAGRSVPAGRWAVGVSGGADSVALLLLLRRERPDLTLHVVHLDHETRGGASADDARFVAQLADRLPVPHTIARRSDVEAGVATLPANPSSRFRAVRLALFRRVVREHGLAGVILAHHADDQAETVLLRLLRGSGPGGLGGMSRRAEVAGLVIVRPMLGVSREALRAVLAATGQAWREDESNASDDYRRNRVRRLLAGQPGVTAALIQLGRRCRALNDWLRVIATDGTRSATGSRRGALGRGELLALPPPVRREAVRRWLVAAGVPAARVEPGVVDRLLAMVEDAAAPARQHFPGGVLVRRKGGVLSTSSPPSPSAAHG